jgi:hypothetical protein
MLSQYINKVLNGEDILSNLEYTHFSISELRLKMHQELHKYCKDEEKRKVILTCVELKMPPEEIKFLIDSNYSVDELKNIATAIANGVNFKNIKENHELALNILNDCSLTQRNFEDKTLNIDFDERT